VRHRPLAFLLAAASSRCETGVTYPEMHSTVSAADGYHLGHRRTQKEKGRGTLQTSALPLGYGAELVMQQPISMLFWTSVADLS